MLKIIKIITVLYIFLPISSWSQSSFTDYFEDGDIDGWTLIDGNAQISSSLSHSGQYSMRAWTGQYSRSKVIKDNFSAFDGIYEAWFYVSGGHADGRLYFQYIDISTHYLVSLNPKGTDNPGIILYKTTGGGYTVLSHVPPTFDQNEWFKCTVIRYASGDIKVYINDNLKISINDASITNFGGFCIGSWQNAYIDDVSFTNTSYRFPDTGQHECYDDNGEIPCPRVCPANISCKMRPNSVKYYIISI